MRLPILALACILAACAPKSGTGIQAPPDCPGAHVILPGNFIIDLAAGSELVLNPAVQEFALFCKPEEAERALRESAQNLPQGGDWRVYRLEGKFSDLARPCGEGGFCLGRPARVEDWLERE